MARANTYTWLPLDTWARMFSYNAWLFNGFRQPPASVGTECHDIWYQYPEQYDTLSREELAIAIQQAEVQIANFVGYNLLPDWNNEILKPPRYHKAEFSSSLSVQGYPKSVGLKRKHLWNLGIKTKAFLGNTPVVRVDKDGDGFFETAQITIPDSVDADQIRIYYPSQNGEDSWEIRPTRLANTTTLEVPVYMIPKWERLEGFNPTPIDPLDDTAYLETVDIYQVYTNTEVQIELLWNQCVCDEPCVLGASSNCGYIKDYRLGYVVYNPAVYTNCGCRNDPDHIKIYYQSGQTANDVRPSQVLDPYWVGPIAYLAPSFFNQEARNCCDGKQTTLVSKWAEDFTLNDGNRTYFTTEFMANNPFGIMTKGAYYAYTRARTKR